MISVKCIGVLKGHTGPVYRLSPGRTAHTFFSGGSDGFLVEWDWHKLAQTALVIRLSEGLFSLTYSPSDTRILIGTGSGKIHLVDLNSSVELRCIDFHEKGIFAMEFSDSNSSLLVLGGDGKLSKWKYPDLSLTSSMQWLAGKCRQMVALPDGKRWAMATSGGEVLVLDPQELMLEHRFVAHPTGVTAIALHPSKPVLVTGGRDAHLNTWKLEGEMARVLSIPAHHFAIYAIKFSPSGQWMATASRDKTIKLWDAHTMETLVRLDAKVGGHHRSVNDLIWLDTRTFASCGDDGMIILWEVDEA